MKKPRKMLCDWNAPYVQSLIKTIETQSKTTLIIWAVDYCEGFILPLWRKYYPDDLRPQHAINAARDWLSGEIKFTQVRRAILECHAVAREAEGNPVAQAAARAIGQSTSTIHAPRHCMGLAFYGALAVAYEKLGTQANWTQIEEFGAQECGRMEDALHCIVLKHMDSQRIRMKIGEVVLKRTVKRLPNRK